MARKRPVAVEVPREVLELTPSQKAQLRKAFRTTIANELSVVAGREISTSIIIENNKPAPRKPGGSTSRKPTAAKGSKKK
jgi:hypothetical protein